MVDDHGGLQWGTTEQNDLDRPVLLAMVGSDMDASLMISLLASCGILARRRDKGIGAYMTVVMGSNLYGIEIDVAMSDLELARQILAAPPVDSPEAATPDEGSKKQGAP